MHEQKDQIEYLVDGSWRPSDFDRKERCEDRRCKNTDRRRDDRRIAERRVKA